MSESYWRKQVTGRPIFPDFEWKKPEQTVRAGNFLIIGGGKFGFSGVSIAYKSANDAGAGKVKVLLPDVLEKTLGKALPDAVFLPSNISGGFSKKGLTDVLASVEWADSVIFIGDSGQNSETALFLEEILMKTDKKILITRDAVDLLKNSGENLMNRENTTLFVSFPQLQKLFQGVYYPKMLVSHQNLAQMVDNLHKFTITYPVAIALFHKDQLVLAWGGQVITQDYLNSVNIWTGKLPTKTAVYEIWTEDLLEAMAASVAG